MNNELIAILNYMEKERGIDREVLVEAVEFALQTAIRKSDPEDRTLRIAIDRKTCDIKAFALSVVSENDPLAPGEISLADAQKINPAVEIGDEIEHEVKPRNLGRIAAQAAKQAIAQKIRQAEREIVFDEYRGREGDIVSGAVRQFIRGDIIVDLGRAEALLPLRERVPTEEYQVGDRIRGLVINVANNPNGPSVLLSRSHPDFVRRLFELEVSEIGDGIVEVKGIAREPGYRTKIAVTSSEEKVDPVGACVGMRGMRVKNIVRELSGEKIDIVRWSPDIKTFVINALSPAKLSKVEIVGTPDDRAIRVVADPEQLSLAIGKRGQNVRLTAKLTGWKVDIQKDDSAISFEEKVHQAVEAFMAIENIDQQTAQNLVNAGFLTEEGVLAAEPLELAEMLDISAADARAIYQAIIDAKPDLQ